MLLLGHTYLRLRLDHGLITEDRDTESLGEAREALCAIIAIQAAGRRIPRFFLPKAREMT